MTEPHWILLPPGDAALTRRVKAAGPHQVETERRGRRVFTRGVWADPATIARIRADLEVERATESFANRKAADAQRRERQQALYVDDFTTAVTAFLNFHPAHAAMARKLAAAVSSHATPVGSGTVARTRRIPIDERAEAAVIAWLRHQTTGYDGMTIARVKGHRREVRRMLAQRSRELLQTYRDGAGVVAGCPLAKALGMIATNGHDDRQD